MENLVLLNNNNNDNFYWNIINNIRWYFLAREYGNTASEKVGEYLKEKLEKEEIENLFNFVVDKRKFLQNRIYSFLSSLKKDERKKYKLGDDSTWDLSSHIVGMGETTYYYVLHHMEMILEYQNNFQENFEYGFDKALYEYDENNITKMSAQ